MDSQPKTLKATLEGIRDLATNALNQIAEPQDELFVAVEVQRLSIQKAFHQARSIRSGWQMPAMQKYGVCTDFVRRQLTIQRRLRT